MLVDSHCHLDHLDLAEYQGSLDALLDAAKARGVEKVLSVAVDLRSSRNLIELAAGREDVLVSVGVHPLQREPQPLPTVEELMSLGDSPGVVAIGETGLDNHYSADTIDWQRQSFIHHLRAARELGKPVIVHTREAREETLSLLSDYACRKAAGVLHCFTENWEMASAALDLNFFISFSGIITFRNATELREVVRKTPLERILVETDSPWLAPVPYRGCQNEPKMVYEVAECVARIKGLTLAEVASATTANFNRLFLGANV